jgi:hypothetical protein
MPSAADFIDLNQANQRPNQNDSTLLVEIEQGMAIAAGDFRLPMNMMTFVADRGFAGRKVGRCRPFEKYRIGAPLWNYPLAGEANPDIFAVLDHPVSRGRCAARWTSKACRGYA